VQVNLRLLYQNDAAGRRVEALDNNRQRLGGAEAYVCEVCLYSSRGVCNDNPIVVSCAYVQR